MISSLELVKLKLLSHSQNMVNAAKSKEWEKLAELDTVWPKMLEKAIEQYDQQLGVVVNQILLDNDQIQSELLRAQKKLHSALQKDVKGLDSVMRYLN